jgi:hypothetical protein
MHSPISVLILLAGLAPVSCTRLGSNLSARAISSFQNMLRGESSGAGGQEIYTHNAACLENFCQNPIIPGLMLLGENVLEKNRQQQWSCANIENTKSLFKLGGFCSRVIAAYPFSMPKVSPDSSITESDAIAGQAYLALQAYVGHLSGMGFDFWDHTTPWDEEDECIKSVWKMSCYTYFPRCNVISPGEYLAPCRSSCENYLSKCEVQCCDEAVQCVFTHNKKTSDGKVIQEHGYPDHKGPSPMCTGRANGLAPAALALFFALLMVVQQ